MNDLQRHILRFLNSTVPADELADMNATYDLELAAGSTFLDALALRTAQLAENSERWAELARRFGGSGARADD